MPRAVSVRSVRKGRRRMMLFTCYNLRHHRDVHKYLPRPWCSCNKNRAEDQTSAGCVLFPVGVGFALCCTDVDLPLVAAGCFVTAEPHYSNSNAVETHFTSSWVQRHHHTCITLLHRHLFLELMTRSISPCCVTLAMPCHSFQQPPGMRHRRGWGSMERWRILIGAREGWTSMDRWMEGCKETKSVLLHNC